MLWNTEGARNALSYITQESIKQFDIILATETFLLESMDIQGFYAIHSYAKPSDGRPVGGVSCFFKPTIGKLTDTHNDDNILITRTTKITIVGIYIAPHRSTDDAVETISKAISQVVKDENVVIAGDLNCRLDKPSTKSELVLEILREEGFTLINRKEMKTYFAYNGASVIDLVFYRGRDIKIESQEGVWSSTETTIRKHIPIVTEISLLNPHEEDKRKGRDLISTRKIDENKLELQREEINKARQLIEIGQVNEALTMTISILQSAIISSKPRKAQPWFNKQCYNKRKEALSALHKARDAGREEDLKNYAEKRKIYKQLLKTTRAAFTEDEAKRIAEEARADPYIALRKRNRVKTNEIPIETWEAHFKGILNQHRKEKAFNISASGPGRENSIQITTKEIRETIEKTKNKKAPGPDNICMEHLKDSKEILLPLWTELFNKCIHTASIPDNWRTAKIKVLYKGKGDADNPNSYRGVALENSVFKIFTKVLTNRLDKETTSQIPECQFGFRRGRSTLQAVRCLLDEIEEALRVPKGKYHVVFIDYTKAFDMIDREKLMNKLKGMIGDQHYISKILEHILIYNIIEIEDGISTSNEIRQTNGVLQGDPISPLLFNIATADITDIIKNSPTASLILYADDMALGCSDKEELQKTLHELEKWTEENGFSINLRKTVHMTFRKGGRASIKDSLTLNNEPLEKVNKFKYLGITLQTKATSFSYHVQERTAAAVKAIYSIKNIALLSLGTAMILFKTTISPIVTYGIEEIWEKLTISDLERMEKVKARFLKCALRVGTNTPSRLVYELARETYYIEDLRLSLLLPSTRQYIKHIEKRNVKKMDIAPEFYSVEAMIDRNWSKENQDQRHVITRYSIHGFHHKICKIKKFHEPSEECVCELCNKTCDRYHITKCNNRTKSLNEYAKD